VIQDGSSWCGSERAEDVNISDVSKMLDIERRKRKNLEAWGSGKGKEKAIAGSRIGEK